MKNVSFLVKTAAIATALSTFFAGAQIASALFNTSGFGVRDCVPSEVSVRVSPSTPTGAIDTANSKSMVGMLVISTPYTCQVRLGSVSVRWATSNFAGEKFHVNLKNPLLTPLSGFIYRYQGGSTCMNSNETTVNLAAVASQIYVRGSQGFALWSSFTLDRGVGVAGTEPSYAASVSVNGGSLASFPARSFVSGGAPVNAAGVPDSCR